MENSSEPFGMLSERSNIYSDTQIFLNEWRSKILFLPKTYKIINWNYTIRQMISGNLDFEKVLFIYIPNSILISRKVRALWKWSFVLISLTVHFTQKNVGTKFVPWKISHKSKTFIRVTCRFGDNMIYTVDSCIILEKCAYLYTLASR